MYFRWEIHKVFMSASLGSRYSFWWFHLWKKCPNIYALYFQSALLILDLTAYILHLQVGFSLKCSLSGNPDFTKVMIVCENSDVRAPAAASYHMITGYLGGSVSKFSCAIATQFQDKCLESCCINYLQSRKLHRALYHVCSYKAIH